MIDRRTSALALISLPLAGCLSGANKMGILDAAKDVASAATLSNEQVRAYAAQMAMQTDKEAGSGKAPASNKYAQRLATLTKGIGEEAGVKLNFGVYLTHDVNAFAMADGTIRFYSGLMDMMTDDEIRYVIGHEIGHIKAGHTRARMQTALATSAAQKAAGSAGNATVAVLANSQLGDLIASVVKAQHSQSNENQADDAALDFMKKYKFNTKACVTALEKLDKLSSSGGSNWLSTHPSPRARADRIKSKLA